MNPAAVIRIAESRYQDVLAEATRDRQAIQAAQARHRGSSSSRVWSLNGIGVAIAAFLGTAQIFGWSR